MHQSSDSAFLKSNVFDYFTYLVEERFGTNTNIERTATNLKVRINQDCPYSDEEVHSFCLNLMIINMTTFGVFIPFKVFNVNGGLITVESYSSDAGDTTNMFINPEIPLFGDYDDEEM